MSTTNIQIDKLMKKHHVHGWKGVFGHDTISRKKIPKDTFSCYIINLDHDNGRGTHWVSVINDPKQPFTEYYDSFGVPPDDRMLKFMKTSGKPPYYNDIDIQELKSEECGWFAMHICVSRSAGVSPYDSIYAFFDPHPSYKNELRALKL